MAYENFTTFTEVDPSGHWSQTATRNSFTLLALGEDSYVYKDYGASFFENIEHWCDVKGTTASAFGIAGVWGITNDYGSFADMSNGLIVYLRRKTALVEIWFRDQNNLNEDSWTTGGVNFNVTYYLKITRSGTTAVCKIYPTAGDRISDTNVIDTLTITCEVTSYRYLMGGFSKDSSGTQIFSGYVENLELIPQPQIVIEEDTLTLSDQIELNLSLDKQEEQDTLVLSDEINVAFLEQQELSDTSTLSDEIDILLSKELLDTLTLSDAINIATVELVKSDIYNKFGMVNGVLSDIDNKISFIGQNLSDVNNKIGFLKSWQVAGDAGYQSLGKTYVKIYINSVEQTDVDIDSISISKTLNSSHSAIFILGRPYDNTKPSQESEVEIKYHIWTLYKGYITQITPNSPDSIRIICQDKYWKQNKTKKYFFVGHQPQDNHELYYNYISTALSAQLGWSPGIGSFVPQTITCFGQGESDCISNLISSSGNYNWFYHVNKYDANVSKKLWTAGQGDIINLEKQEIGKNLGLYQILRHAFRESIENIVNKFRVQMGNIVIRRFNKTGGNKEYSSYRYEHFYGSASPAWDFTYERLAQNSPDGKGVFHHPVSQNDLYQDVFSKYSLPSLSSDLESWSDAFPPIVNVLIPFDFWKSSLGTEGQLTEGFTIDYENGFLIFNEPIYLYQTNEAGEMTDIRAPEISLQLWKRKYYSNTEDPSDNPATDISNPLMFFTDKMGEYPETIMENLELGGLGIQIGGWYISGYTEEDRPIRTYVPSWNDTNFAQDYANWQLSKRCDKKINGNIEITIDTICFYDINLSKRIIIDGIIENPLNIESIILNIGNWRASIGLQSNRYYKRNVSFQNHGV